MLFGLVGSEICIGAGWSALSATEAEGGGVIQLRVRGSRERVPPQNRKSKGARWGQSRWGHSMFEEW